VLPISSLLGFYNWTEAVSTLKTKTRGSPFLSKCCRSTSNGYSTAVTKAYPTLISAKLSRHLHPSIQGGLPRNLTGDQGVAEDEWSRCAFLQILPGPRSRGKHIPPLIQLARLAPETAWAASYLYYSCGLGTSCVMQHETCIPVGSLVPSFPSGPRYRNHDRLSFSQALDGVVLYEYKNLEMEYDTSSCPAYGPTWSEEMRFAVLSRDFNLNNQEHTPPITGFSVLLHDRRTRSCGQPDTVCYPCVLALAI
jgi:hypothetical protein